MAASSLQRTPLQIRFLTCALLFIACPGAPAQEKSRRVLGGDKPVISSSPKPHDKLHKHHNALPFHWA